ncbi:insulinase family protein [Marinomonas sp. 2405UD68-3]|uniref:insulinase family protein n=1 Tax=Marinomonas sp. 2405UD68-3 TaxID=3391835 RepID=UPI0039C98A16
MTKINQSINDKNHYKSITLKNGLLVLLVSDPKAEKSAASLSVNVGSYQDPKGQEGLAHFLEHMLFLGTEKYPDAASYQAFITEGGGSNNAYTSNDTTNFYFDIQADAFQGALDRFSQFFISPLFSKEFTDREKNAVHSEYLAKINDDSRRSNQAFKTLLNPKHPQSNFSVGSLETLKNHPNLDLQVQLKRLFDTYYKANNMALTLVSSQSITELEELATHYFSNIKYSDVKTGLIETVPDEPLTLKNAPSIQFIQPIGDIHKLQFLFPIPSQLSKYHSKPSQYLTYILGHEGAGSLLSYLKHKGLANALGASSGSPFAKQQFLTVSMRLTDKGIIQIDDVLSAFSHTLNTLKNTPIQPLYLDESKTLSHLAFNYYDYIHPIRLASILSSRLLRYPVEDVISSFKISSVAQTTDIKELMSFLTFDNLFIQLITKEHFPQNWSAHPLIWETEHWYQSKYTNFKPNDYLKDLFNAPKKIGQISLPEANPYLPEDLSTINEFDEHPRLIFQVPGITYWHRSDNRFDKPESNHFLAIRFKGAADTAEHYLLNRLLTRLFDESMSEQTYLPYVAGLGYRIYPHLNGVTINTSGYSNKQFDYLKWLLEAFLAFTPSEERFNEIKQQLTKDLSNQINTAPYQLAISKLSDLVIEGSTTIDEMIAALPSLNFQDLLEFMATRFQSFNLVAFSNGNVTNQQSHDFAQILLSMNKPRLNTLESIDNEAATFSQADRLTRQFEASSEDQSVLYVIREANGLTLDDELKSKMLFAINNQLFSNKFYSSLRTKQQFGYIVSTHNFVMQNVPSLAFTVQSPTRSNTDIVNAIERFIESQHIEIQNLHEDYFNKAKSTIMKSLVRESKSLKETTGRDWREIAKLAPDFQRKERLIETLNSIDIGEFQAFYKDKIQDGNATRIVIHNHPLDTEKLHSKNWTPL